MTIDLQRGRFLRVMDGAGSTLTARGGEAWITEQDPGNTRAIRPPHGKPAVIHNLLKGTEP